MPNDTVLLSFKLTVGRLCITDGVCTTNEAIAHFVRNDLSPSSNYTFLYLNNFNYQSLGSTSSIATAVNSKTVKSMKILLPQENIQRKFEVIIAPVFNQIKLLEKQNKSLEEIRDSLLPRLISGKIPVGEIEKEVADAM